MKIKKAGNSTSRFYKKNSLFWLFVVLIGILFVFVYRDIVTLFYQQDEWFTLGQILADRLSNGKTSLSFVEFIAGRERPFSIPIQTFIYSVFTFNTIPFALFSLVFHGINTALVGCISYRLTKKYIFAYLTVVFFLINQQSQQALTWFAANTTTLPSLTLGLLAIWFTYIGKDTRKQKWFLFSQIAVISAYMFKESAISIMMLLPLLLVKPIGSFSIKQCIKTYWLLILYIVFLIVSRTTAIGSSYMPLKEPAYESLSVVHVVVRSVWYPFVSLSQQYIPQGILFRISGLFQTIMYPFLNGTVWGIQIAQTVIADMFSIIGSGIVLLLLYIAYQKIVMIRSVIILGLFISVVSFLPFSVLPRANAYLDSRYFYMSTVGGALLFSSLLGGLWVVSKRTMVVRAGVVILTCMYLGINGFYINKNIQLLQSISEERKNILVSMEHLYPTLPKRVLIYSEGSTYGYYAIPELKWPFQQGVGFTLMTWYYKSGTIPASFIHNGFLWDILSEGYTEEHDLGFGYVRHKEALVSYIREYHLTKDNIIGIYYDHQQKQVIDISDQIRKEVFNSYVE